MSGSTRRVHFLGSRFILLRHLIPFDSGLRPSYNKVSSLKRLSGGIRRFPLSERRCMLARS
jgi:hypothetical protein